MTSEEKAKELYSKMYFSLTNESSIREFIAKKLCILFCDEMLDNAGFIWGGQDTELGISSRDSYRKYWNEVKQIINRL